MGKVLSLVVVLGAVSLTAGVAVAQDSVKFKKKTVIDLTGALIEGELIRPEGTYIVNRKASRFSKLIRYRASYVRELLASPDEL